MEYLFGGNGLKKIHSICSPETLFAFDFDGTLSTISRRPNNARIAVKTQRFLHQLSALAPLAIVSGRSLTSLRAHIGFKPQYLIGNHGVSGLQWEKSLGETARRTCRSWRRQIERFFAEKEIPGAELEDNRFTLAFHYRQALNKDRAKTAFLHLAPRLSPSPHIIAGKSVLNIVPQGLPDKGAAFQEVLRLSRAVSAFYIGDDHTDETVFALTLPRVLMVRVGYKKTSSAGFFIRRQSEINKLLQMFLDLLNTHPPLKQLI